MLHGSPLPGAQYSADHQTCGTETEACPSEIRYGIPDVDHEAREAGGLRDLGELQENATLHAEEGQDFFVV